MGTRIAISMGDFNGIGPEIVLKSLEKILTDGATPVVIGHTFIFDFYANLLGLNRLESRSVADPSEIEEDTINFFNLPDLAEITPQPGSLVEKAGASAMQAVEKGIDLCMAGQTQALVTAPISKEAINKAGYHYPGHTEFLAEKTQTDDYLMMLVYDELRVGLVTIHIPIADIPKGINAESIQESAKLMHTALANDFGIYAPRIAVLGLNPHAGDGGVIGNEEKKIIEPAVAQAKANGMNLEGPYPADGFFGSRKFKEFDGVLAMYHDQGLVPFKTISFGGGVNVTAGLPIVRTSPDHGTAFDIAGQNVANASSFIAASTLAIKLSRNRMAKSDSSL